MPKKLISLQENAPAQQFTLIDKAGLLDKEFWTAARVQVESRHLQHPKDIAVWLQ